MVFLFKLGVSLLNMSFSHDIEGDGKQKILDVNVFREEGQFVTNVYPKPTFSRVYTHCESYLSVTYKFGMVYTLAYRYF